MIGRSLFLHNPLNFVPTRIASQDVGYIFKQILDHLIWPQIWQILCNGTISTVDRIAAEPLIHFTCALRSAHYMDGIESIQYRSYYLILFIKSNHIQFSGQTLNLYLSISWTMYSFTLGVSGYVNLLGSAIESSYLFDYWNFLNFISKNFRWSYAATPRKTVCEAQHTLLLMRMKRYLLLQD